MAQDEHLGFGIRGDSAQPENAPDGRVEERVRHGGGWYGIASPRTVEFLCGDDVAGGFCLAGRIITDAPHGRWEDCDPSLSRQLRVQVTSCSLDQFAQVRSHIWSSDHPYKPEVSRK